MGKENSYKVGDQVYIFLGDRLRKQLCKSTLKQEIYFVELKIIEVEKVTATDEISSIEIIHGDKLFNKHHPYSGHAFWIKPDDKHLFTPEDFEQMRHADDDELDSLCEACGFKRKEFKKAFKPFRIKKENK